MGTRTWVLLALVLAGCDGGLFEGAVVCDDIEWPDVVLLISDADGTGPDTLPAILVDGEPADCSSWDPLGTGLGVGCYDAAGQMEVQAPSYQPVQLQTVHPGPADDGCQRAGDVMEVVMDKRTTCDGPPRAPSVVVSVLDSAGALDGGAEVTAASRLLPDERAACALQEDGRFACLAGVSGWIEVEARGSSGGRPAYADVFVQAGDCEALTEELTVEVR